MSDSKNNNTMLVWLPLPPGSGWRGEGIVQTIENIVCHISSDYNIEILVSLDHYHEATEAFDDYKNIKVVPLSYLWLLFRLILNRKKISIDKSRVRENGLDKILKKSILTIGFNKIVRPIALFFDRGDYVSKLKMFTVLHKRNFLFRKCRSVWCPSPNIFFQYQLRSKKIFSFWDPFVFEYESEYSQISEYFMITFARHYFNADIITTQSKFNKRFLIDNFAIDDEKIKIINNGAPDYTGLIGQDLVEKRTTSPILKIDERLKIMEKFPLKPLSGYSMDSIRRNIRKNFVVYSQIFKLRNRINNNSKLLFVSTQNRPYKGFSTLFMQLDKLIKHGKFDLIIVFTSKVDERTRKKYPWFLDRVFEITRVSNLQHAHIYMMSDLVLHPSYIEGGMGSYPQYEAASLGIPSLMNSGRHMEYLKDFSEVDISKFTVSFENFEDFSSKVYTLLHSESTIRDNILESKSTIVTWTSAAEKYKQQFFK